MLLLYRIINVFFYDRKFIYIPLCFYFIVRQKAPITPCLEDLHSTMLLLYRELPRIHTQTEYSIYIPLCFYFIQASTLTALLDYIIYIPLCFYFILGYEQEYSDSSTYLHSTMLLLYRWRQANKRICALIYIPLCFYFIIFSSS